MTPLRQIIKACLLVAAPVLLCLSATTGRAGDFAEFRPLGFSADGTVFGFEEFGVQDGSGFPYANRYFINTSTDSYAAPPVRVRIDDDTATLADARATAAATSPALAAGLSDNPGIFAAYQPATELRSNGLELSYTSFAMEPFPGGPYKVQLSEKPLPASAGCAAFGEESVGFKLRMTETDGELASITLQDDASVPASRNCPTSYRLGGALTHANPDGSTTHVILILVRSHGFEGADGRWIAVTRRLN
ncbi:putative secreted protein [Hoeflea marina]|uniref:Putative secreted protein n=1 Tax=Hoeflea marina TaxID=274592 RepID=A0A317PXZ0_9HYPH|nr:DUF2259 domain-containing protein [Hoeflea marina]PWW04370.1 putative secreted protein [Hoeflea marina]